MATLQPSSETAAMEGVHAWHPRHLLSHVELFEADQATLLSDISATSFTASDNAGTPPKPRLRRKKHPLHSRLDGSLVEGHLNPSAQVESQLNRDIRECNEIFLQAPSGPEIMIIGAFMTPLYLFS